MAPCINGCRIQEIVIKGQTHRGVFSQLFGKSNIQLWTICKKGDNDMYKKYSDLEGAFKVLHKCRGIKYQW